MHFIEYKRYNGVIFMSISRVIFAISAMLILSSIASAYTIVPIYHVTVQSSPTGSGYEGVASSTVGYTCASNQTCTYNFTSGTALTFYAYNFSNTKFTQWSGVGGAGAFSSSLGTVQTTLDSNITETASFLTACYGLNVVDGNGVAGQSVTPLNSTGCPEYSYAPGTQVTVTPEPKANYYISGGRLANSTVFCISSTPGVCQNRYIITINSNPTILDFYAGPTATKYHVTVQSSPAGSGYEGVASSAVGYTCPSNQSCTYNFTSGTALTFYAYNFSNTKFTQWSGVGAGAFSSSLGTVQTTLDSNITETASFVSTVTTTVQPQNVTACNVLITVHELHGISCNGFTVVLRGLSPPSSSGVSNASVYLYDATGMTNVTSISPGVPAIFTVGNYNVNVSVSQTFVATTAYDTWAKMEISVTPVPTQNVTITSVCNNTPVILYLAKSNVCGDFRVMLAGLGEPNSNGTAPAVLDIFYKGLLNKLPGGTQTLLPGASTLIITSNATSAVYLQLHLVKTFAGLYASQKWAEIEMSVTNTPPPSYTLTFHKGWNLFSVPLKYVTSYVANSCNPTSSVWTLVDGRYIKTINILGGAGYWVYMPSNCSITVSGPALDNLSGYNLTAGWNMIGSPGAPTSFNQIKGTCNATKGPYGYSTITGYHVASTLGSGNGYLVYVSDSCTLGAVNSSSPPSLP